MFQVRPSTASCKQSKSFHRALKPERRQATDMYTYMYMYLRRCHGNWASKLNPCTGMSTFLPMPSIYDIIMFNACTARIA
eukprot:6192468-Pleurochrysis_carterae.AAC.1